MQPPASEALAPVIGGLRRVFCCHSASLSGRHPHNSIAAVAECVEARVPRLELDVRFLADDAMVLFHDPVLDRDTTSTGPLNALDRAAIANVRRRDDSPLGFLEQAVDLLRGHSTLLQVDLKLMRPISDSRTAVLTAALKPLGEALVVGSTAHWNLRPLAAAGLPVAFDPTFHINAYPEPLAEGSLPPVRRGLHGFWDDSPLAHVPHASAQDYLKARLADLCSLVPGVRELMVDQDTILRMAGLGVPPGPALRPFGVELTAWTILDRGPALTTQHLSRLLEAGATTIITDSAVQLAAYADSLQDETPSRL